MSTRKRKNRQKNASSGLPNKQAPGVSSECKATPARDLLKREKDKNLRTYGMFGMLFAISCSRWTVDQTQQMNGKT